MMKYIFTGLILLSVIFGAVNGTINEVSEAAIECSASAIELCITLGAVMCLWCGIMETAAGAGLTELIGKAFTPILSKLFRGIDKSGKAMGFIVLNLSANLLGLGNASTPLGISAMKALSEEENAGDTATDNMILLTVLNTASLQIIPTTAAALRLKNGSENPFSILPAVWIVSGTALIISVIAVKVMGKFFRTKGAKN